MKITFLIGNGFDLRVGMKTRFADMYEEYISKSSASDTVRKFKEILAADAPKYETWGDFEMAMAQKARDFDDEDSFIECLRDFKLHMVSHLEKEQLRFEERISLNSETVARCVNKVVEDLGTFYNGLRPNVINEFLQLGAQNNPEYSFVSFNYTKVFDRVLSPFLGEVIHVHGSLGSDIVLGADNLQQVGHLPYIATRRFGRAFVKPEFNKSYDNSRVERAMNSIDSSDVICVYGMSLGNSDLSWKNKLREWLLAHENNHLVYFVHDEREFDKSNWDAIMDEEERRITELLEKICYSKDEMSKLFEQVHIPVGYDIFGIDNILTEQKRKLDELQEKREVLKKQLENRPVENGILTR